MRFNMASPLSKLLEVQQLAQIVRSIEDKFRCQICLDLLKHPAKLRCEHKFCRMCIEQHIRNGVADRNLGMNEAQNKNCPLCGKKCTNLFPTCCLGYLFTKKHFFAGHKNITKRSLEDDTESSPLRNNTMTFIRSIENILDVDLKTVRDPPVASREATTPKPTRGKPDFDFKVPTTRANSKPESKARKKIVNDGE